jgi:hypothetical protein
MNQCGLPGATQQTQYVCVSNMTSGFGLALPCLITSQIKATIPFYSLLYEGKQAEVRGRGDSHHSPELSSLHFLRGPRSQLPVP